MSYKEDMKFHKHLSLWDWQSSGVSARNKFRRSMAGVYLLHRFCFWFIRVLCFVRLEILMLILLALLMTSLVIKVVGTLIRALQRLVAKKLVGIIGKLGGV